MLLNSAIVIKTTAILIAVVLVAVVNSYTPMIGITDKGPMKRPQVTELIVTPFGYPNPYSLGYVAQYRFVHQVGEFLVRRDNLQNFAPGLAHTWSISDDRRSITFDLRPGLYTAEEVKQSLVRLFKKHQTSHSNIAAQIVHTDQIVINNPLQITINTNGDAGAILAPLVMADTVILPDSHWSTDPVTGDQQVDWRKTRGPYIYESGSFPAERDSPIIFKPNPDHYFFNDELLTWKIVYHPIELIQSMDDFKALMMNEPSYSTLRYWDMIKFYEKAHSKPSFYETRPNGISFIVANPKSPNLNRKIRRKILKTLFSIEVPLNSPTLRAYQIAQPGLSGKMSELEIKDFKNELADGENDMIKTPLKWHLQNDLGDNANWIKTVAKLLTPNPEFIETKDPGRHGPQKGKMNFDLGIFSVGMSDTDPISGATFLFSPMGMGVDLPNGEILKILNSAKQSTDRSEITNAVKAAFQMAMDEALIMPISYVTNRHYYSDEVELNIQDPFAESVRIWEVRIKQ